MELSPNYEVLKEPRGFIKLLEIVLAICAFATAVDPHISISSKCNCNGTDVGVISVSYKYPCLFDFPTYPNTVCQDETNVTSSVAPPQEPSSGSCLSSSQFYVFVGVIVFLYSLGTVIFYVIAHDLYEGLAIIPKTDFVITVLFTIFWLASSAAFADAVTKIKTYTDLNQLKTYYETYGIHCDITEFANYASLNVSIIFGFLNMLVWCGNNWFLYKETNWFDRNTPSAPQQQTSAPQSEPKV